MGRPIQKKYFGNTNVPTIGGEGVASVTIGGTWAGFTDATTTVTFTAPQLPGGVTATGTATIVGGAVTAVVMTNNGSGYTSAPTVTIADSDGGAETTGTATAVLTSSKQNSIAISAYVTGGSAKAGDIVRQTGSRRYRVTTADGTETLKLVAAAPAAGEMTMTAEDSAGGTYYVTKLTAHRAVIVKGDRTGTQFTTGADGISVPWTFESPTASVSVKILNA